MLAKCLLIVVGLILGLAQVAAVRRLVSRRTTESGRHGRMLVLGGLLLLVASIATRWTPQLPLPAWIVGSVAVLASTTIIAGVALIEASKRSG
ncbi:MAG: hypothetical protein K0V04_08025 [Deltaproteobacteria bacterium]|nr:hypothetical protein [Deltaproteobacteria bacterium]